MSDYGSWMPNPSAAVRYDGEIDVAKAQRYKFFAAISLWLLLAFDAALSGVVYFESGLTPMGSLCVAGIIFTTSLLVLVAVLAVAWSVR